MELFIKDETFQSLYNLDTFESFIWTDRYKGFGNFELYTPINQRILQIVDMLQEKMEEQLDCYIWSKDAKSTMIIEDLQIVTDVESGNHLTISGRGLESILERRIIWNQTSLDGNLQEGVEKLINESIINPSISDRKIPNFVFQYSQNEYIKKLEIRAQYTGDNLYDVIMGICDIYQLGFDVFLDSNNDFVFLFTVGEDRSYDQDQNPYVIFSTKYENIINSDYLESEKTLKNVTLVAGEDQGDSRKRVIVGEASGLARRELYTDARDIQSEPYAQELEDDKEILGAYEQQLSEDEESLSELIEASNEETEEYLKTMEEYAQLKKDYETRILSLNQRVSYYNSRIAAYVSSLSADQKISYDLRNQYKIQIENYENLIDECTNKINSYNDKLKNERTLTYDKVVQYEEGIEAEENKKSGYEDQKKPIEESKREEEKKLPDYEDTLDNYEKKISKYEGIVSDDEKTLSETIKASDNKAEEYLKRMEEYKEVEEAYENRITESKSKIEEYNLKIIEDEKALNELYDALLKQRGRKKLSENVYTKVFTSEIEAKKMFVYEKDFFKGDIVQIVNEYNMESRVRVSEIVRVQDVSGNSMYPTFEVVA